MFNPYLTYYKTNVQLLAFCLLFLLFFLLGVGIDIPLIPFLTDGLSYESFSKIETFRNLKYVQAHRIIQLITQLFVFIIPALVFAYLAFPKPAQYLKLTTKLNIKHVLLAFVLLMAALPFFGVLEHLNKMIPITSGMQDVEDHAKLATEAFLETSNLGHIFLNFLIFVVIAAVGEELLFRGVFQNILLSSNTFKKYPFLAIAIAAMVFSLFHMQMAGLIPRFAAGFLIGCAYYFSNNLIVPIIMHALNNGFVLLMFYTSRETFDDTLNGLEAFDFLYIIPLTILGVFLFYKFYQTRAIYVIDKVPIDPDETNFLANIDEA